MPKAMVKIMLVLTFMFTPAKPITPATMTMGSRLGMSTTTVMRNDLNRASTISVTMATSIAMP